MKAKIKLIYRPYRNGMYRNKYIVAYESRRVIWYDLSKLGKMPESHFNFMMNAKCIPIYANKHNGTHEGEHLADKFV